MAKEPKQKEASVDKQEGGSGSTETFKYAASSSPQIKTLEEELFELVQLSEVPLDKELFKEILELLKVNVAPGAILQVLSALSNLENGGHSATPTRGAALSLIKEHSESQDGQSEGSPDHAAEALSPPEAGIGASQPPTTVSTTVTRPQPSKGTHSKLQSKGSKLKRPIPSK